MNVRPYADSDLEAATALVAADEEALYGERSRVRPDDLATWMSYYDEARVYEEDGRLAGVAMFGLQGDTLSVVGVVADKGRGIGTSIAEHGEELAAEQGAAKVHGQAREPDAAARRLFEGRGYREVRRFWDMAIELDAAPAVPPLPDGLVLDACRADEYRAFYEALDESFRDDHWGWHSTPYEGWLERRRGQHADSQGPLWWVVRDGNEIAAVARNEAEREGGGYVGALGVRRPWRGRGLAKALLLHSFAEFHRRGRTRVTLGVDAENSTGATHLYERVGMRVERCGIVFEKELA